MNVVIFGDSFSAYCAPGSWINLLAADHGIRNFSTRGASQYRIYRTILQNLDRASAADIVVCCHTNPDRIFVPDRSPLPSRSSDAYKLCDMVAADSLDKKGWQDIARTYYRYFYDDDYQQHMYDLLINQIITLLPNSIHISGFPVTDSRIKSISEIHRDHKGHVNHLDEIGNIMVYDFVSRMIKDVSESISHSGN